MTIPMMKPSIKSLVVALVFALILTVGSGCQFRFEMDTRTPTPTTTPTPATPIEPTYTLPYAERNAPVLPSIAEVVAELKPSVVAIDTEIIAYDVFRRPFTREGTGSGWIVDAEGLIVTNNHVVEGAKSVTVSLADGRTFPAVTIRTDPLSDLAVIKIEASNLPAAKVGDSSKLKVGDWVVAIGNPLGLGISATKGIVSRLGVSVPVSRGQTLYDLIQTDASINPGNSGGPLVNMAGEVIGITSAKIATIGVEGMGYAISSNSALPIIQDLIQKGYVIRPWLGVLLQDVTQLLMLRYNLAVDKGAFIVEVTPDSPAAKAGLKSGDVIVDFAGKKISNVHDLIRAIHTAEIGQSVGIAFWRGNSEHSTFATLIESPPP